MRIRRATWVSAVLIGGVFGAAFGAFIKLDGESWTEAVIAAVVTGIPFGVAMGRWGNKWLRDLEAAEGDLPADKAELANRAAWKGPIPEDPEVRAAAIRIARQYLRPYSGRFRRLSIILMVLLLIGCVVGAVTETPMVLLSAALPVAFLYVQWSQPRHLRRRIKLLSEYAGLPQRD